MKSRFQRWLLLVVCGLCAGISAPAQTFVHAEPGYQYQFPRDHFSHPDYQTEWWYYTGNLQAKDGHRYGFELTFFREGSTRGARTTQWGLNDIYMAHLALSDISGHHYYATERLNRAGPGIAGADATTNTVWNGNWQTVIAPDAHQLRGVGENFALDLRAIPRKNPVIHGEDGISRKSATDASHYISFTRMATTGTVTLNGVTAAVEGDAWMDHEFFTNASGGTEVGWDWLSIQLADGTELMLYRLRHTDGSIDPFSSGSYIPRDGNVVHLALSDFTLKPAGTTWKSSTTAATYPPAWTLSIPRLQLELTTATQLQAQEFVSRFGPTYWEGAIDVNGHHAGAAVRGSGYLEMTGYDRRPKPMASR